MAEQKVIPKKKLKISTIDNFFSRKPTLANQDYLHLGQPHIPVSENISASSSSSND